MTSSDGAARPSPGRAEAGGALEPTFTAQAAPSRARILRAPRSEAIAMRVADLYGHGPRNPLPETAPFKRISFDGILYATDRAPAEGDVCAAAS